METATTAANNEKRTNSLAFAQTDCHTCASLGDHCDRRRPRCSTCLGQGRECGGFATPLSWDSRRMWTDVPPPTCNTSCSRPDGRMVHNSKPGSMASTAGSAPALRFRFVRTGSRQRKRRKTSNSKDKAAEAPLAPRASGTQVQADTGIEPEAAREVPDISLVDQSGNSGLANLGEIRSHHWFHRKSRNCRLTGSHCNRHLRREFF
ncbi:hypothetical protein BJY00DRAFT_244197 [Aspergillus carlsbadensis]|nr:hypothetical protein BJY00DRAFT_244197 [Aspergillus carlsbadensis]